MGDATTRIRIAIADDHPIFRDGLRKLLSLEPDFELVAEAGDGTQVIDMLREDRPDILLLDLKMPVSGGVRTLLNLQPQGFRTKTIVLTASEDQCEHLQAIRYGASAIVMKQTATQMLTSTIRKVQQGQIWLDAKTTAALTRQFTSGREIEDSTPGGPPLTDRQRQIVALVGAGFKNRQIAEKLFVAEQTVKNQLRQIFDKLGVSTRLEAARHALENEIRPS